MTDSSAVTSVAKLQSNVTRGCSICGAFTLDADRQEEAVRHLIEAHQLRLLHVGQESSFNGDASHQSTVFVLRP